MTKERGCATLTANNHTLMLRLPRHPNVPRDLWDSRHSLKLRDDDKLERRKAERIQSQASEAIEAGKFNLEDYLPARKTAPVQTIKTVRELMSAFLEDKSRRVSPETVKKDRIAANKLIALVGDKAPSSVTVRDADAVKRKLENLSPSGQRVHLWLYRKAWAWAVKRKWAESNPFEGATEGIKDETRESPGIFSSEEQKAILEGFEKSRHYRHYLPFVRFLFATGTRVGEAAALQWKNVNEDCSKVGIFDSLDSEGKPKGKTKTFKSNRVNVVPASIQKMLQEMRDGSGDIVFSAKKGGYLDIGNFNRRAWKGVLTPLVKSGKLSAYHSPYSMRKTFGTNLLDEMKPGKVVSYMGTSLEVFSKHYLGVSQPEAIPDFTA
jgi:integrase